MRAHASTSCAACLWCLLVGLGAKPARAAPPNLDPAVSIRLQSALERSLEYGEHDYEFLKNNFVEVRRSLHGCFVPSCAQVAAWGALAVGTSQEEHCVDDGCQLPCAPRADIESGRCAGTSWTVRAVLLGVSVDGEARADHDHVARNSNAVRHGRALQELHAGFRTAVRTHLAAGGLFVTRSLSHWGTSRVRQITLQLPVPGLAAQPASPVSRHPCGASGRVHHGFRHDDNRVCAIALVAAAGSPVRPSSNSAHAPRYAQLAPCSSCSSCRLHLSRRCV